MREWLPPGHLALFISDVIDSMDLRLLLESYEHSSDRGWPPYHEGGEPRVGEEVPAELRRPEERLARIREARAARTRSGGAGMGPQEAGPEASRWW